MEMVVWSMKLIFENNSEFCLFLLEVNRKNPAPKERGWWWNYNQSMITQKG